MNPDVKLNELITKNDFKAAFDVLMKAIMGMKDVSDAEMAALKRSMATLSASLQSENSANQAQISSRVQGALNAIKALADQITALNTKISSVKDGVDGKDGKNGVNGKDGKSVNQQEVIDALKAEIPPQLSAGDIRDELESLNGEYRLDASAIKNLPKPQKQQPQLVRPLSYLPDVDTAGISAGDALKWTGIRWIPFTPVGGNTSVYNEVVAGNVQTFTLANTPVAGKTRVYANGQRLTPTVDYTLAGAVITTVGTWATGNITSDYEY